MRFEVCGMQEAAGRFVQLLGKYVSGFDSDKHCHYCLKGKQESRLHRKMEDDSFYLESNSRYFYLFAMGRSPKHETNVHLVVEHRPGSVASIGSAYGATFTIRDALALRVDRLPDNWRDLPPAFTTCRNFQFGVKELGYSPSLEPDRPGEESALLEPPTDG